MNGRRVRTSVIVILLVIALGTSLVLTLRYVGVIQSFTVVADSGNRAASPIAVVVSQLMFAAITVSVIALLGWSCLRSAKRGRNRDDS